MFEKSILWGPLKLSLNFIDDILNSEKVLSSSLSISKQIHYSGILDISIDRPVMKADINLSDTKFDELCRLMMKDANRPVTVIMLLDLPLSINLAGDLLMETAAKLKILDLSWIIPLK